MKTRRGFLRQLIAGSAAAASIPLLDGGQAHAADNGNGNGHARPGADMQGACLVDTTLCIGCRKCEEACNRANHAPRPERPFSDRTVLRRERRPTVDALTVVNQYAGAPSPVHSGRETHVKVQCMHCLDPACVSACIVGALRKSEAGPVRYDPSICMGCRYCMVACPFQIPAYEYHAALAPRVRKCEFCANNERGPGPNPACAAACPMEAIVFGRRGELLALARERIAARPDRYNAHIYGEHEVGGTSWMYLSGRPHTEIGLFALPVAAPPRVTEHIQHTIFRYGALPIAVYGALGALKWYHDHHHRETTEPEDAVPPGHLHASGGGGE